MTSFLILMTELREKVEDIPAVYYGTITEEFAKACWLQYIWTHDVGFIPDMKRAFDEWFDHLDLPDIEDMERRQRDLMKHIGYDWNEQGRCFQASPSRQLQWEREEEARRWN